MSIEKMTLVNIKGPLARLDDTILQCSNLKCFHPENIALSGTSGGGFATLSYRNPYQELLQQLTGLMDNAGVASAPPGAVGTQAGREQIEAFANDFSARFSSLRGQEQALQESIDQHQNALIHLRHLAGLDFSFDQLFSSKYVKVRLGRLPRDNARKLDYFGSKPFLFYPFDEDENYVWSVYFTTQEYVDEIDDIFAGLFFERVRIPDYIHGTPQKALGQLQAQFEQEQQQLEDTKKQIEDLVREKGPRLAEYRAHIRFLSSAFDLRRYVGVSGETFYMVGFIPKSDERRFAEGLGDIGGVSFDLLPEDTDRRFKAPTKLKNNWFFRPFEMFVGMYGLPSHEDIDPTPYVAIAYSLLFGIMFGDLGQGLLLSLIGFILYRWKKLELGRIMERIGLSSALFGLIYGSVFGFEHALDGFYRLLGFAEKPVEVMDASTINILLIGAVGLGAALIFTSILINVILGFRQRDMERAIFSQNGLAGLVLYGTVLISVLGMLSGFSVLNPVVAVLGIALPILLIFLREPLTELSHGHKVHIEGGVGTFIAQNFFELFEVALSFIANTMSFLRVGGFILSHAGMMAVVFTISGMVSAGAGPVVVVLGNLFVMCLEGLIVGIQVLRLQFYEMFSRFFSGEGEPFEPIRVDAAQG